MLLVTLFITKKFIYSYGMLGAAMAFLIVMIAYLLGISIIYYREKNEREILMIYDLTVIVPVYNMETLLPNCLR